MQSVSREESRHNHNKNPSTASTNSRGAGCENKHMDAVQRNKLNIHSVGTEMKSLAANMPNHRVQFTLLRPVWNVNLFASKMLLVSYSEPWFGCFYRRGFSFISLCVGVRAF